MSCCYRWIHVILVTKRIRNKALRHKVYIWVMDRVSERISEQASKRESEIDVHSRIHGLKTNSCIYLTYISVCTEPSTGARKQK